MSCGALHLAVLAPIADAWPEDHAHVDAIEHQLEVPQWQVIETEFLRRVPTLHMARFQVIDHLYPGMGLQYETDRLVNRYLLFVAEGDGYDDDLIDELYHLRAGEDRPPWPFWSPDHPRPGGLAELIWRHCGGFPAPGDLTPVSFRRFMHSYRIPVHLPYAGVPGVCLVEILRALVIKEITAAWLAQGEAAAAASIDDFVTRVEAIERMGANEVRRLLELNEALLGGPPPLDFEGLMYELGGDG